MSALETSVVVELGVGWQAKNFPVLDHRLDCRTGKDGAIGPRSNQTSVQRYGVEDFDVDSTFDDQAFNNIEAIEFTAALGHLRQIPTGWRGWMTSSMPTIQSPTPLQDAPNGSYGRDLPLTSGNQVSLDCLSPVFTQDASVLEFSADPNHQVFNASLGALNTVRPLRAILPVDSAQSFPLSSLSPIMDRGEANMKSTSHRSQRFTLTHGSYHRLASLKRRTF